MPQNLNTPAAPLETNGKDLLLDHLLSVPPHFDFESIVKESPSKAYKTFEKYYPPQDRWRLFVDGTFYMTVFPQEFAPTNPEVLKAKINEIGWLDYESREKNAIAQCLHALEEGMTCLQGNKTINNEVVKGIHFRLTKGLSEDYKSGAFRVDGLSIIYLKPLVNDYKGILDLLNKIASNQLPFAYIAIPLGMLKATLSEKLVLQLFAEKFRKDPTSDESILDHRNLKAVKDQFPEYYDKFLHEAADYISSYFSNTTYHPVASQCGERITLLKQDLWSRLKIDECYKKPIELDLPENLPVYTVKSVDILISKLTKDDYDKIVEYISKVLSGNLNAKLDDTTVNNLIKLLIKSNKRHDILEGIKNYRKYDNNQIATIKNNKQLLRCYIKRFFCLGINQLLTRMGVNWINELLEKEHALVLSEYYKTPLSGTNKEIIQKIGSYIQNFQRIHAFRDGAGRTYVNVLLNILLISNGFPPATYYQPNMFDAFNDIAGVIARGIWNTSKIYAKAKQKEDIDLFGLKTADINTYVKDKITEANATLALDPNHQAAKEQLSHFTGLLMEDILKKANDLCVADPAIGKPINSGFALDTHSLFAAKRKRDEEKTETNTDVPVAKAPCQQDR